MNQGSVFLALVYKEATKPALGFGDAFTSIHFESSELVSSPVGTGLGGSGSQFRKCGGFPEQC